MLNIVLSPDVPDTSEFDPDSFKELCRQGADQVVRFVMKKDTRIQTQNNWRRFLDETEQTASAAGSPINLSNLWAMGPERASPVGEIPNNTLDFMELTSKSPKQMYRTVVARLGKHESVSTIEGLFEELSAYSVNAQNITIYDKWLMRIPEDIIQSPKKHEPHDESLRKLALICKAISPLGPPNRVTIVTEFTNTWVLKQKKKKQWKDAGIGLSDYFSSSKYTVRTENIARSTVTRLRQLFPELEDTEFRIWDCSDPSLDEMMHDRFILFGSESLLSSAGFAFRISDKNGRWDDLSQLPENLSSPDVLSSTQLDNSTYIVPVSARDIILPRRAREISIEAA